MSSPEVLIDKRLTDLVDQIELEFDDVSPRSCESAVGRFALAAVGPVREQLPSIIQKSLKIAERYWDGSASVHELERARVDAWATIDGRSCDFESREVNLARLAICALYQTYERGYLHESLCTILDFAKAVGIAEEYLYNQLRRHFDSIPST